MNKKNKKIFIIKVIIKALIVIILFDLNNIYANDYLSPKSLIVKYNESFEFNDIKNMLIDLISDNGINVDNAKKILSIILKWEENNFNKEIFSVNFIKDLINKERLNLIIPNDLLNFHRYFSSNFENIKTDELHYYIGFLARMKLSQNSMIRILADFLYKRYSDKTKKMVYRGYDIPIELNIKTARIFGQIDNKGNLLPAYLNNHAYVNANLNDFGEILSKESTLISFPRRQDLNLFLKENPAFSGVIDNIRLGSKGELKNFMGLPPLWNGMANYKNAEIRIEIVLGKIISVYAVKDKKQLYPFSENHVYENAYIDEKGNLVNGNFLPKTFIDRENLNMYLEEKSKFTGVIEKILLKSRGRLGPLGGIDYWERLDGYENKLVKVYLKDGVIQKAFDYEGNQIYPFYSKTNQVYIDATFDENNNRIGTNEISISFDYIKSLNAYLETLKDISCVIENVPLGEERGDLRKIANEFLWFNKKGYEGKKVKILIKNGKIFKIADYEGNLLYEFIPNKVYVNASIDDKGNLIGNKDSYTTFESRNQLNDYIKGINNFSGVIENIILSKNGGIGVLGVEKLWNNMGYLWNVSVNAEFKNGKIKRIFDYRGNQIFPFSENHVYIDAKLEKNGTIINQENFEYLSFYERTSLNKFLKNNPRINCIIDKVRLYKDGGLGEIGKNILWFSMKGYTNKNLVKIVIENGEVTKVVNEDGVLIYPYSVNNVFKGAYLSESREVIKVKEEKMISFPTKNYLSIFLKENPDFSGVVENVELNNDGGLGDLGFEHFFTHKKTHKKELITIEIKAGKVSMIIDKEKNVLYNAKTLIEAFSGAYIDQYGNSIYNDKLPLTFNSKKSLSSFLANNPYFSGVFENFVLDDNGGLRKLLNKSYWSSLVGYSFVPVKIYFKNGKIVRVFDYEKNQIYPFMDNKIFIFSTLDYFGERIDKDTTKIKTFKGRHELNKYLSLRKVTGVIEVKLNGIGGLTNFEGKNKRDFWNKLKGYENQFVRIYLKEGEVKKIFTLNNILLYPKSDPESIFNKLWNLNDIQKLVNIFGEEDAGRIIVQFYNNMSLIDILDFSKTIYAKLKSYVKNPFNNSNIIKPKDLINGLSRITLFKRPLNKKDLEIVKDVLQKRLYKSVIKDSNFLEKLKNEISKIDDNSFLKECLSSTINSFETVSNLNVKGLQDTSKLKFYQLAGVDFILKAKRALLSDEPGLGKTIQALTAALNAYDGKGAQKILIICPHISKDNVWLKQIKEHLRGEQKTTIINKRKDFESEKLKKEIIDSRFIIVNPELIRGIEGSILLEEIKKIKSDFIIVDEAHNMRNDSLLSDAILKLDAEYKVLITGTPLVGREPKKLFNLLNWLDPYTFSSPDTFIKSIETGEFIFNLRKIMIRRYVTDVYEEMPKFNVIIRKLSMLKEQALLYYEIEKNIIKDLTGSFIGKTNLLKFASIDTALIYDISFKNEKNGGIIEQKPGIQRINIGGTNYNIIKDSSGKLFLVKSVEYNNDDLSNKILLSNNSSISLNNESYKVSIKIRKSFSSKLDETDKIIKDIIENKKESAAVFTSSLSTVKKLQKRYINKGYNVLTIYGKVSVKKRNEIIKKYNSSNEPYIIICTYQSAGESISLIGGQNGILIDQPWTVQEQDQIFRRVIRLGQKNDVTFYVLQNEGTIDKYIMDVLNEGAYVEKVLIDHPNFYINSEKEIVERTLKDISEREENNNLLLKLRKSFKSDEGTNNVSETDFYIEELIQNHGLYNIKMNDNLFESKLLTDNLGDMKFSNIKAMLKSYDSLHSSSQDIISKFISERLNYELERDILTENLLLKKIFKAFIPGMENIDYDPKYNLYAEIGSLIIRELINFPNLSVEDIILKYSIIPKEKIHETLIFLEINNIFKLFQKISNFPNIYYSENVFKSYKGEILIHIEDRIKYTDKYIVNQIAPKWEKNSEAINLESLNGFKKIMMSYRDLTNEELELLIKEFEKGNKYAGEVIILSYAKKIIPIANRALRKIFIIFGGDFSKTVELERLYSYAIEILPLLIKDYTEKGIYDTFTLWEYVSKPLSKRIYKKAFDIIKEIKELTANAGMYGKFESNETSYLENMVDESAFKDINEKEVHEVFINFLREEGYTEEEIFIVKSQYILEEKFEKIALDFEEEFEKKLAKEDYRKILEKFKSLAKSLGYNKMKTLLSSGYIEENEEYEENIDEENHEDLLLYLIENYEDEIFTLKNLINFDYENKILKPFELKWESSIINNFILEFIHRIKTISKNNYENIEISIIKNKIMKIAA